MILTIVGFRNLGQLREKVEHFYSPLFTFSCLCTFQYFPIISIYFANFLSSEAETMLHRHSYKWLLFVSNPVASNS